MLSERTQEIQELRKQLSDMQQQLAASQRQNSTTAQEGHLETAELRAQLAEKDGIISVSSSGIQLNHSASPRNERGEGLLKDNTNNTPLFVLRMMAETHFFIHILFNFAEASAVWSGEGPVPGRHAEEGGA